MSTPEEIRREQEEFALNQLKEEGVDIETTSPHKSRSTLMMPKAQSPEAKRDVNKKRDRPKSSKGHYACLAKIVSERRNISFTLKATGEGYTGELLEFDDEALRVRFENGKCVWFFKHALESFEEEERKEVTR